MTASVQRFRFQYPDRSIKKGRVHVTRQKPKRKRRAAEEREGPEDERVADEWHTPSGESGRMLYSNKGHVEERNIETIGTWGKSGGRGAGRADSS